MVCMLSSELIENARERVSSGWAEWREMERVRPRGERLGVVEVLGVRGRAVRGVVGKTAVAGTSSPSLRRRRSSLARRWVESEGASEVEEPDAVEGALEMIEGATESTEPRWWYVGMGFIRDVGESRTLIKVEEGETFRSGGRCVGLRLRQVDSASVMVRAGRAAGG